MKKKYIVTLTEAERRMLQAMLSRGKGAARKLMHARILLKADAGPNGPGWDDNAIAQGLEVGTATVERVRKEFVEEGLEAALKMAPTSRMYEKLVDGDIDAHLIALACGEAPEGYSRWSPRLLADKMVELRYVDEISYETVRRTLKKTNLSLGK